MSNVNQNQDSLITNEIRDELRERASQLDSGGDISKTIFHTLTDRGLDVRRISLDEMKNLVVVAVRAFQASTDRQTVAA